ncbi:hypothetical protein BC828DRAFT_377717 [Blastocladiella britannica]|nr:hypothetical protein BC828DRAFT_377717 [Blastocladiella britannica]
MAYRPRSSQPAPPPQHGFHHGPAGAIGGGPYNTGSNVGAQWAGAGAAAAAAAAGAYAPVAPSDGTISAIPAQLPPGAILCQATPLSPAHKVDLVLNRFTKNALGPLEFLHATAQGETLYMVVRNFAQAQILLKLSGIRVPPSKFVITMVPQQQQQQLLPGAPPATAAGGMQVDPNSTSSQLLIKLMESKYDAATGILDFSRFSSIPVIKQNFKLPQHVDKAREAMGALLLIKQVPIRGFSLAGNTLSDLRLWGDFLRKFPGLEVLDVSNNNLTGFASLDPVSKDTHPNLRTLDTRNNPVSSRARAPTERERYMSNMQVRFPSLTVLDGDAVVTLAVAPDASVLPRLRGSLMSPDVAAAATQFVQAFMHAMDNDRNSLASVYHSEALFSVAAFGISQSGFAKSSRNILELTGGTNRFNRIFHSPAEIIPALAALPRTTHDVTTLAVDAWLMPQLAPAAGPMLSVFIHGELQEHQTVVRSRATSTTARQFDRAVILLSTQGAGPLPFVIVQDQWTIRSALGGNGAMLPWKAAEAEELAETQRTAAAAAAVPLRPEKMSEGDYNLVLSAMQQFGLNWDGAIQCLQTTQGDMNAIATAKHLRQIPEHMFSS